MDNWITRIGYFFVWSGNHFGPLYIKENYPGLVFWCVSGVFRVERLLFPVVRQGIQAGRVLSRGSSAVMDALVDVLCLSFFGKRISMGATAPFLMWGAGGKGMCCQGCLPAVTGCSGFPIRCWGPGPLD